MDLWLIRHADAVSERVDPSRPLSPEGVRDFSERAEALKGTIGAPALVASSRKRRARQTAAILAAAAGYPEGGIVETDALSPAATPEAFLEFLSAHVGRGTVVCVGHLPAVAEIAAHLLSADGSVRLVFRPGMACGIRLAAPARGSAELILFR